MPGPPPKDPKLKRRRTPPPGFLLLPREGRQGDTPPWPLPPAQDELQGQLEAALWEDLWQTPQAVEWGHLGWTRIVARYARLAVEAEGPLAPNGIQPEVRQLEDRLGLTPMAMMRLRWMIDDPEEDIPAKKESPRRVRAVDSEDP